MEDGSVVERLAIRHCAVLRWSQFQISRQKSAKHFYSILAVLETERGTGTMATRAQGTDKDIHREQSGPKEQNSKLTIRVVAGLLPLY
jgi:hypothetical protein